MSCISRPNEDAQKSFILHPLCLALGDDDQEAFLRALPFLLVQLHKCSAELPKVKPY